MIRILSLRISTRRAVLALHFHIMGAKGCEALRSHVVLTGKVKKLAPKGQ